MATKAELLATIADLEATVASLRAENERLRRPAPPMVARRWCNRPNDRDKVSCTQESGHTGMHECNGIRWQ